MQLTSAVQPSCNSHKQGIRNTRDRLASPWTYPAINSVAHAAVAATAAATPCFFVFPAAIIKEVAMMRMLAGHPCAVQLQAVYEDKHTYYLVRTRNLYTQLGCATATDSLHRQLA
jgi:hypothetical protein